MMAGLLDMLNDDRGLLGLYLLDAAGPRAQPASLGQRLLGGFSGYKAEQTAAEERRQRKALQELQMGLLGSQIEETKAQASERAANAKKLEQAAARQQAFQQALGQGLLGTSPQQALAGGGGPTAANAAQIGQQQPINWQGLAAQFPEQIDALKKLAEARNFGADKVARTVETADERGRPATAQFDDYGRRIGSLLPKAVEMKLMNLGGSEQAYDPYALQAGQQFTRTQTPDSKASNALGWANFGLSRDRLAMDKSAPKGQYDAERGLLIDPRTGQAIPVTQGGQPIGAKPSAEVRKEMLSINQQSALIDGAIKAVDTTPSAFGMARGLATMTGPISESVAGRLDSDAERQARAFVFNNVSAVINERAGAAQSAQELARLRGFLPAEVDDAEQIKSKLKAFQTYLDEKGRGTTGVAPQARPSSSANGMPGMDAIEAELRRRGVR